MTDIVVNDDADITGHMIDVGGYLVPPFPGKDAAALKQIVDAVSSFPMRNDDIMLCSYPKTGSNWLFEVVSMMLQGSSERIKLGKFMTMMEAQTPEEMESLTAPRIMNCHLNLKFLPSEMKTKQTKTILLLRNPKDTAVSYYNHMKGFKMIDYEGEWKDSLLPYLRGEFAYGKYTDYLLEWQKAIEEGVGFPLHVIYFEDLKLNGVEEINKLEKFLGLDLTAELMTNINEACTFDRMKQEKQLPLELREIAYKKEFQFFRKGQIGDWKNWFTVRQNEIFDEIWKQETKGLKFSFTYTPYEQ